MNDAFALILSLPALLLIANLCVSSRWANQNVLGYRKVITTVAAIQFLVAAVFAVSQLIGWIPQLSSVLVSSGDSAALAATIYYDGVASLMLALVSFVGWVTCRYSIRYLDGESTQGRYFKWAAFTIGSVSLMIVSGNLLMFVVCWVLTSLGLHQLLMHYGHRPAAKRAAWTKFTISRLGDAALISSIAILYSQFNTLDFAELFETAGAITEPTVAMMAAAALLVAGAITKSAQFPFHTWLPQTMETPTPVSALMHAGIVNAGGYLIIRTSPLVSLAPWALTFLAVIGAITACGAAVIMLTQTSVKKSLAYSTIAQMGFMMLQCGLGAYSAAMLHILAHSLYKAHAFLSSGSVMADRYATQVAIQPDASAEQNVSPFGLVAAPIAIVASLLVAFWAFGVDPLAKSGGLLLGGVLCLAMTHWVWRVMAVAKASPSNAGLVPRSLAIAAGLCTLYVACFVSVDAVVAASTPVASGPQLGWFVAAVVVAGFAGMFALQIHLQSNTGLASMTRWRIHASNGFYLENALRRVFGALATS